MAGQPWKLCGIMCNYAVVCGRLLREKDLAKVQQTIWHRGNFQKSTAPAPPPWAKVRGEKDTAPGVIYPGGGCNSQQTPLPGANDFDVTYLLFFPGLVPRFHYKQRLVFWGRPKNGAILPCQFPKPRPPKK